MFMVLVSLVSCLALSAQTDMTSRIANPSFETGDFTGWSVTGMGTQGNSVFSIKQGNIYVERWTGRGGAVGDARLSQTLRQLPAGRYRLKAAAQTVYDTAASDGAAEAAITALAEATFAFRILNGGGSGAAPVVTTDPRYVRGCTWAFGRSTVETGIADLQGETDNDNSSNSKLSNSKLYDLSGRRVSPSSAPKRGVYVVGGRKVLVR